MPAQHPPQSAEVAPGPVQRPRAMRSAGHCLRVAWAPPADLGGARVLDYTVRCVRTGYCMVTDGTTVVWPEATEDDDVLEAPRATPQLSARKVNQDLVIQNVPRRFP